MDDFNIIFTTIHILLCQRNGCFSTIPTEYCEQKSFLCRGSKIGDSLGILLVYITMLFKRAYSFIFMYNHPCYSTRERRDKEKQMHKYMLQVNSKCTSINLPMSSNSATSVIMEDTVVIQSLCD